jgi:hypothetical protein
MMCCVALLVLACLPLGARAEQARVNEFLADNASQSFADEDGDTPDWIELADLYLTDDSGDLTKWPDDQ